jgi:hypothetical protein
MDEEIVDWDRDGHEYELPILLPKVAEIKDQTTVDAPHSPPTV